MISGLWNKFMRMFCQFSWAELSCVWPEDSLFAFGDDDADDDDDDDDGDTDDMMRFIWHETN